MDTYHSIILKEIETVDLSRLPEYGWKNRHELRFLYGIGSLTDEEIRESLAKNIRRTATEDFELLRCGGLENNGIKRPEVLAYVIPKIGNTETLPSLFMEFYNKNWKHDLSRTLTRELLEPTEPAGP